MQRSARWKFFSSAGSAAWPWFNNFYTRNMGTIGKGLSGILLVLQISSSSVTFPVSMTSPFSQTISPYLPFTYAIRIIRETIGGIVPEIVTRDSFFLFLFLAETLLTGLSITAIPNDKQRSERVWDASRANTKRVRRSRKSHLY